MCQGKCDPPEVSQQGHGETEVLLLGACGWGREARVSSQSPGLFHGVSLDEENKV